MDVITLGLSKKYTSDTADGLGAVKGAPCTIKSVEQTENGNKITFEWTGNSGAKETSVLEVLNGADGKDGKDGENGKDGAAGAAGTSNPLANKKVLCVGDSICEGVGANNKPYSYWLKEWHSDTEVINLGVGGMTIAQKDSSITNAMPVRIANGEFAAYKNVDVIVFEGGINDLMNNVKLGYISKGYAPTNYKTFCQGMEYMFNYFKSLCPTARMIFMSTHNVTAYDYNKAQAWWGAASEICAKWGVEFLDLFSLICTAKISGLELHPAYTVHRDYYAKYLDMALTSNAPLAAARTTNYYKHNVPIMLQYHSGTKQFNVGGVVNTSDWRINMIRGDLTTYENVSSKANYDTSDVNTSAVGEYTVHVFYTEDGITLSTDVVVSVVNGGNVEPETPETPDTPDTPTDEITWDDTTTVTAAWKTTEGVFSNITITDKYSADTTYNVSCKLMVESDTATSGKPILRVGGVTSELGAITFGEVVNINVQMKANANWTVGNMQPNLYTTEGSGFPWTAYIKDLTITAAN